MSNLFDEVEVGDLVYYVDRIAVVDSKRIIENVISNDVERQNAGTHLVPTMGVSFKMRYGPGSRLGTGRVSFSGHRQINHQFKKVELE